MSSNVALGNGLDASKRAAKKAEFLEVYAENHNITNTAVLIGVHPATIYRWKADDPEFAQGIADCEEIIGDHLEELCYNRASEPNSDVMKIFMLKRFKPQYRDNPPQSASIQDNRTVNIFLNGSEESKQQLDSILAGKIPSLEEPGP